MALMLVHHYPFALSLSKRLWYAQSRVRTELVEGAQTHSQAQGER